MTRPAFLQLPARQRIRRVLLLVSFLLFPLTLYYFSPVLIMQSASEGIINASFLVFVAMFVSALFVGWLWCGWACPSGCPMSLDVHAMVAAGRMENDECILCGTCVDNCAQDAICYTFSSGK